MQFTYLGHSAFIIIVNGKRLLFDPFISGNSLAQHIDCSKIETDYILVSHGHGDHLIDAATIAQRNEALVISSPEICA